jgi:AmmeMemoRadiSam system protein B
MVRQPAVAGQFYAGTKERLSRDIAELVKPSDRPRHVIGLVAPHAGYIYSGAVAGEVYGGVVIPKTVVILGPNHHGVGARAALSPADAWLTPLGSTPLEKRLASLLMHHASILRPDDVAHLHEHSIEVQLPFLQTIRPDVTIVPVCIGFGDINSCQQLGSGVAAAIREFGEEVLIVASSDMTHYEPAETAREKDELALEKFLALDPEGLLNTCRQHGITMCGVIPATVLLIAASLLGASKGELVSYATSGDVTGDNRSVVAYAGLTVT